MSTPLPDGMTLAAEVSGPRRRRHLTWGRVARGSVPYGLILPVLLVVGAVTAYPLYSLVRLSFEKYGLFELIAHHGPYVGLTMVLGTAIALLLVRLSTWVRILLTAGLVLVWSVPVVVAVQVWYWMTNYQNGVLNYVLTQLHLGNFFQHDWYATTFSQLGIVTAMIVWGALPFVVVTVYAALSQVPRELIEAAEIDGASSMRVFRDVTVPILTPVLLILTSLSIIWDFGVFPQPYLLIGQAHTQASNFLMGTYLFEEGYIKTDFGRGAAISLLMLLIVAVLSVVYVRKMVKIGDVE